MEDDFEERLIEEVKKHECLYNLSLPDYKKIDRKEKEWREVAEALCTTVDVAKRKWRNIKDYFFYIKKAEKLPSGSAASKRKKWKHLESCSFLNAVPKLRATIGNLASEDEDALASPLSTESEPFSFTTTECRSSKESSTECRSSKKKNEDFQQFLKCATETIQVTCETMRTAATKPTSMGQFFDSLEADIVDANLTTADIRELKLMLSKMVYDKIASTNQNK